MSTRLPGDAQQRLHRYVAVLFAVSFPSLAIIEIARFDMAPTESIIRWATYLVLAVWAIYLSRRPQPNTMTLVVTTMGFFGSLSVIEAVFGVGISAFDFATIFWFDNDARRLGRDACRRKPVGVGWRHCFFGGDVEYHHGGPPR